MCHDADIIVHTKERLDEMMMKIQLHWVKSHQDKSVLYEELGMAGRMNVDANRIAEVFRLRMQRSKETSLDEGAWTPGMETCLIIEGKQVQSHYAHRTQLHVQGNKHRHYLQGQHGWHDKEWDSIDWRALKSVFLSLGPLQQISCSK